MSRIQFPIQEEIDALRHKFFVGPGDDNVFYNWGQQAMELALEWLKNSEGRKIHADISLPELANLFRETNPPEVGSNIESVFEDCRRLILDNSVRVNDPRYIGHMTTAIPWFSVVVNTLITATNQNQIKIETALASTYVERQTLCWLHRLIYQKDEAFYQDAIQNHGIALGNMTSGGTLGTLTALAVAREKKFPGTRQKGLWKVLQEMDYTDIAILSSKRAHYSLKKSVGVLGLGEQSVIAIPVDFNNRIQLPVLKKTIQRLKKKRVAILAIMGIAGTTETGNIDLLAEMAEIAQQEDIWFHVDAAWGGALLLSNDLRPRLKGIEQADSVVIDGHKLFYLPIPHGSVLFKDPDSLNSLMHNANYVIRKGSVDLGRTTIEGSRAFNALKLWFSLKILGMNGYDTLLKKSIQLVELMAYLIDEHPDFERTSTPELYILTYRFVPPAWQQQLKSYLQSNELSQLRNINKKLNDINVELQKRQRENGKSFVSRTVLESTGYPQEIVVLRTVLTNLLTKSSYLQEILEEQRQIGYRILGDLGDSLPEQSSDISSGE